MHFHCEIIMPPTEDIAAAVAQILAPFDENATGEAATPPLFWDWYVIGGRYSGEKLMALLGADRVRAFHTLLHEQKLTIASFRAGKPTLQPASQISTVDALWREHFPDSKIAACPLFDHYKGNTGDVMPLSDVPQDMTCERVILAASDYTGEKLEAFSMVSKDIWNGVEHMRTTWDGTIKDAVARAQKKLDGYGTDYAAKRRPVRDWLVVTVDYHS